MDYLSANFCLFPFRSLSSPWLLHSHFPEPCSVSHDPSQPHSASPAQARPTLVTLEHPPVPRAGPHPTQGPYPHSPSGGSSPLGPEGWKPPRAHSIICLFWISTTLDVSVSSFSGHAGKIFPARLLATCRGCRCHPPPTRGVPSSGCSRTAQPGRPQPQGDLRGQEPPQETPSTAENPQSRDHPTRDPPSSAERCPERQDAPAPPTGTAAAPQRPLEFLTSSPDPSTPLPGTSNSQTPPKSP